ncbi:protein-glutamate methylesterase/protein-glutamine glutaminase [Falsibacillus albus]|uniref:Protein-glutamate methylesterase/protein-glutamine glutaminase n=1 Tax=Falsibacillus albus TaxID=2478915 RepID=A0A3L7JZH1_9BACI|nr:chemotaxis response regulator protein-glutamate methylesterase [Falsibacillus albus]RLQ95725.1 chemotaxis response regulator protein-glutamate methylesterase [Falsibacillus albus]
MKLIKVLVVDDSAFMRKLIINFLEEEPFIEVVGFARNGEDALKKINILQPDVITLDIEMPIMNGLEALKKIMQEIPTPVVMLSSMTKKGADQTVQAMDFGAVDFVAKPSGTISLDLHKIKDVLVQKVISASKVHVSKLAKPLLEETKDFFQPELSQFIENEVKEVQSPRVEATKWSPDSEKLICIGTSTGGPRALQQVLTSLKESIDAPILCVQHMPPGFTKSLADRLNQLCEITVKEAEDGEILRKGCAYIAPGGYHLCVKTVGKSAAIQLNQSPPRNGHRPSVDVMFESISELQQYDKVAVIMTGMGSDGATGLKSLKDKGNCRIIAESENTCIVYGMPKAALQTNLVDDVEDLGQIANAILKYMNREVSRRWK